MANDTILETLRAAQDGRAIENLATAFDADPSQTEAAIATIIGDVSRAMERNTLSRGGLADLVAALGHEHHRVALEEPRMIGHPMARDDGNAILAHLLGSKDASRGVAERAAFSSGLGEGLIKMMLPFIVKLIMGAIAGRLGGGAGPGAGPGVPGGDLGDILKRLPGGGTMGSPRPSGDIGAGIPSLPGGAAPAPPAGGSLPWPLPRDGDAGGPPSGGYPMPWPGGGTMEGDVQRRPSPGSGVPGGGASGGFPLPMPVDDAGRSSGNTGWPWPGGGSVPRGNPLPQPAPGGRGALDELSDVLRRGGAQVDGNPLGGIVRNVLGGLLGFQSKGVLGWILRFIVVRFGWGLIKRLFGRLLVGR